MATFTGIADPRLDGIVDALADQIHPELILLFGSRARGNARDDSDYDLMVVVREQVAVEPYRRAAYAALWETDRGTDILVRSIEAYQRRQHDPGCIDFLVSREGRLLYTSGLVPQRSPAPRRLGESPEHGEKLLKALIAQGGTFPPKTHELKTLLDTLPRTIRNRDPLIAACRLLTDLYPKSRYPEEPFPNTEEARLAIEAARATRDILLPLLKMGAEEP